MRPDRLRERQKWRRFEGKIGTIVINDELKADPVLNKLDGQQALFVGYRDGYPWIKFMQPSLVGGLTECVWSPEEMRFDDDQKS